MQFIRSAVRAADLPHDRSPQLALVGRSNVGKSTLINAMTGTRVARTSAALVVRGRLQRHEGVTNLVADRLDAIEPPVSPASRDFR